MGEQFAFYAWFLSSPYSRSHPNGGWSCAACQEDYRRDCLLALLQ